MQEKFKRLFCLIIFCLFGTSVLNAQQINNEFVEGEIYVKLKTKTGKPNVIKLSSDVNIALEIPRVAATINSLNNTIKEVKSSFYFSKNADLRNTYRIKLSRAENIQVLVKQLMENPDVEYVEPVRVRKIIANNPAFTPNDPQFASQWYLSQVQAPAAWDINPGGGIVKVAVVDNAIQTDHVDLAGNMLAGYDVSDNDTNPNPPNASFSHGTHVAGIVSAVNNNSVGIASAANNKVKIIPIKATHDTSFYNSIDNGYEGIAWAIVQGADIISLSWGGEGYSQTEQNVINDAYDNGILVIAAAGNEDNNILQFPAAYDHVISVAALDNDDRRSSFSSYGTTVDIASPGRGILSTVPTDAYAFYNGTSMATPLVASCAGYLLSCFPTLSPDSLEYILKKTADDISAANPSFIGQLGAGRLNLLKAISCKAAGLFDAHPIVSPTNFFCSGDSVLLSVAPVGSETFRWKLNNTTLGTNSSYYAKVEGNYYVERTAGTCVVNSDSLLLIHNKTASESPNLSNIDIVYCDPKDFNLAVGAVNCDVYGPKTFSYSGPEVGFDGYAKSGSYPRAVVSGMGGLIDSVSVSITWQKKDGNREVNCDEADYGGKPFNEEFRFSLISPEGIEIPLLNEGTYASGTVTSGVVTTVFTANGAPIPQGSLPTSGNFKAAGNLALLHNRVSQGTWTLIANDSYLIDPLCVSGFSVTVKSQNPVLPPKVKWYSSANLNSFIQDGATLPLSSLSVGIHDYFATTQCEGTCPSAFEKAEVVVRNVPEIFAFPMSSVLLSALQIDEIRNAQSFDYSVNNNLYTVFGTNAAGNPYSYQVSSQAPLVSPISICGNNDFAVFGLNCEGTIQWSNGQVGPGIILENVSTPYTISATCNQSWACAPLSNIPFSFTQPMDPISLNGSLLQNSRQTFYGNGIESTQRIEEFSAVEYIAPSSVLLKPGFSAGSSTVFKAEIGNCGSH